MLTGQTENNQSQQRNSTPQYQKGNFGTQQEVPQGGQQGNFGPQQGNQQGNFGAQQGNQQGNFGVQQGNQQGNFGTQQGNQQGNFGTQQRNQQGNFETQQGIQQGNWGPQQGWGSEKGEYNRGYPPQNQWGQQQNNNQNYMSQGGFSQQGGNQQQPESAHEHPLNYIQQLNDQCKVCMKNIGGKDGYKCNSCEIVLCFNCANKIFYGNKKKSAHSHPLALKPRISWKCDLCQIIYQGVASFYCKKCDFDVCEKCYLDEGGYTHQQGGYAHQQGGYQQQQGGYQQQQGGYTYQQGGYQQQQGGYPQQQGGYQQQQGGYPQQQGGYQQQQGGYSQQQGGYQQQQGDYPQQQGGYPQQQGGYPQQQGGCQQQPESAHEHPLNYSQQLNEQCKICMQNIGGQQGYKCNSCNIVLCLNCANRVFYGNKKKSAHYHPLALRFRESWKCDICKIVYRGSASFYCKQCDFDACDKCYLYN